MFKILQRQHSTAIHLLHAAKVLGNCAIPPLQLQTHSYSKRRSKQEMNRIWEPTVGATNTPCADPQYKLMSYNILAQDLLTEHLYLYLGIDPTLLRWESRLKRLCDEITGLCPDILCLQEMQFNHIKDFVKLIRGKRKLEYVFKKKTGQRTDGCAIIYDRSKFRLLEERSIEYHNPGSAMLNRENIALMAKFNVRDQPDKNFIVATTHLLYNPRRQDKRIAQVEVLLAALRSFSLENRNNCNILLPIVLTGDFNFEPNTPPYVLLSSVNRSPKQNSETNIGQSSNKRKLDDLQSPKKNSEDNDDSLELCPLNFGFNTASTFQERWITVDFILHSIGRNREKVKIWSIYKLPAVKDLIKSGKIPDKRCGSDHYSLAIVFSVP